MWLTWGRACPVLTFLSTKQKPHSIMNNKALIQFPGLCKLSMVAHICNPLTQEGEVGESEAQDPPYLYSEFKASLRYIRLCIKKKISI